MTERLVTAWELLGDLPVPEKRRKTAQLDTFTRELFQDAMIRKLCDMSGALSAVYLSGLLHGMELGPQATKRVP